MEVSLKEGPAWWLPSFGCAGGNMEKKLWRKGDVGRDAKSRAGEI